jgi:nonsense-mediated mRNA decay protein 3|tara:strand:+ start:1123 stop:1557 length:435 start_codon:yes stop_codon:yes gene_type:complete
MEKKHKDYFEGTLQLRNVDDEVIDFVIKEIEKTEDIYIAKVKKVTNGFDIYISRQRFLRSLGNKLQQKFGGQIKVSTKLHTRHKQTGRELHRVNVLFRMPKFKKGDIIDYKGDKIEIISMHKKVFAKDVKTGKKLNLSFKDLVK